MTRTRKNVCAEVEADAALRATERSGVKVVADLKGGSEEDSSDSIDTFEEGDKTPLS